MTAFGDADLPEDTCPVPTHYLDTTTPIVLTTHEKFSKELGKTYTQLKISIHSGLANHIFGSLHGRLVSFLDTDDKTLFIVEDESGKIGRIAKRQGKRIQFAVSDIRHDWLIYLPGKRAVITKGDGQQGGKVLSFSIPDELVSFGDIPALDAAVTINDGEDEGKMNKSTQSAINGLQGVEQKVYEAIPISEAWNTSKIMAELKRNGHNIENKTIVRCAKSLTERGLLKEGPSLSFTRKKDTEARPKKETVPHQPTQQTEQATMTHPAEQHKKSPMELLADLAERLRQFAADMDNAALEIEQEFQTSESRSAQLKQLQTLLKTIAE